MGCKALLLWSMLVLFLRQVGYLIEDEHTHGVMCVVK
jgi:hypothetical protein